MISSQPLNAMQIKLMIAVKSPSPALRWRTQSCEFARPYRQCLHRWRCSQRYSGCRYGCVSDACHAWHFARRINGACDRQNAFAVVFPATCCRVAPVPNILRHRSTTSVVITRRRPPTLPCSLAAAKPARVRSTINSRSISARALMTWKKKRPAGVEVSIELVRLRKFTPRACSSDNRNSGVAAVTISIGVVKTLVGRHYDLSYAGDTLTSRTGSAITFVIPAYSGQCWSEV